MVYIYDILLNFNKNLIEYFEWEEKDKIKYVKKVVLVKVTKKTLENLIKNEVELEESFLKSIPNYEMNGTNNKKRVCLLTDGFLVVGTLIKNNKIELYSRLLLDEEREVLEIAETIDEIEIIYKINKIREKKEVLTRKEQLIKESLIKKINSLYENKEYQTLYYLYYEYTQKEKNKKELVYKYLISSLENFNKKHIYLYNILLLSNKI